MTVPPDDARAACRATLLKACRQAPIGPWPSDKWWVELDDAASCMAEREAKWERLCRAADAVAIECAYLFERHGAETTEALQSRGLDDALAYRALCDALAAARGEDR